MNMDPTLNAVVQFGACAVFWWIMNRRDEAREARMAAEYDKNNQWIRSELLGVLKSNVESIDGFKAELKLMRVKCAADSDATKKSVA